MFFGSRSGGRPTTAKLALYSQCVKYEKRETQRGQRSLLFSRSRTADAYQEETFRIGNANGRCIIRAPYEGIPCSSLRLELPCASKGQPQDRRFGMVGRWIRKQALFISIC
jgi:hypothetical protein